MIYGPNWLFVQNPKAASSSIGKALASHQILGPSQYRKHDTLYPYTLRPAREFRVICIRNPWDRMVSAYVHTRQMAPQPIRGNNFEEFLYGPGWMVRGIFDFKRTPQTVWAHGCNQFIRFENLRRDFSRVFSDRIGLPPLKLPYINKTDRLPYQEYYTNETRELIADRFRADIDAWGYKFEET